MAASNKKLLKEISEVLAEIEDTKVLEALLVLAKHRSEAESSEEEDEEEEEDEDEKPKKGKAKPAAKKAPAKKGKKK